MSYPKFNGKDPDLGWINNGVYSQRNPKREMSLLERQDFQFIQWFFEELWTAVN
jgi:hypothetical protein